MKINKDITKSSLLSFLIKKYFYPNCFNMFKYLFLVLSIGIFLQPLKGEIEYIGIVILQQPSNPYHKRLADNLDEDIENQFGKIWPGHSSTFDEDFLKVRGFWTVHPLFQKISEDEKMEWIIFLEDHTRFDAEKLLQVLDSYNSSQDVFAGYALEDPNPTIIHHFASTDSDSILRYPHFSAGFFISSSLAKKLTQRCGDCIFSIDPKYELAKFIWDTASVKLTSEPRMCLVKDKEECASWVNESFPNCGLAVSSKKIGVAVKTCEKFHQDRVTVVKGTWAPDVENLFYFGDTEDESIPTIVLDVENVPSGHCEKTLRIMKYYIDNQILIDWLAVVDDDTLLNFGRLRQLLACYNSSQDIALGERYGYSVTSDFGYDYLTGGSGMIFSMSTVKKLVRSCKCPSIDSPDDMIIGMCLKSLKIPAIHSPYFHQARPNDYSHQFLAPFKHITFHKHWMIDPYDVYREWLQGTSHFSLHHSEL